jgi:chromosome segregation ATPase
MPRKKKSTRVAFNDNASAVSDRSSTTNPSVNESDSHDSDTESTVTSKRSTPKIRFRSSPPPKKTTQMTKVSAREVRISREADDGRRSSVSRRKVVKAVEPTVKQARSDSDSDSDGHQPAPESAEQDELLSRISSAIPDLHLLLDKYKATHGELSLREHLRRRFEAQTAEIVRSKDDTITALISQLDEMARQRADESSKLKGRMAALELSYAQLKEQLQVAEARAKHAEEHRKRAVLNNEELVEERALIIRKATEDKDKALKRLEKDLKDEFEQTIENLREEMETKLSEEVENHETEIEEIKEQHDSDMSSQKDELEAKINKAEDDIKELGGTDSELKAKYEAEWQKKEDEINKKHESEVEKLKKEHEDYCNGQIRGFLSLQESLNKALTEENKALKTLLVGKGDDDASAKEDAAE